MGAEPNQGLYLASALERAGFAEVCAQVEPVFVNSGQALYDDYRQNWISVIGLLAKHLPQVLDPSGCQQAIQELASPAAGRDYLLEIALVATATKPSV